MVVAVSALCCCMFFHPFKSSKGGEAVNKGAKDKGHYTFWQRVEKISSRSQSVRDVKVLGRSPVL